MAIDALSEIALAIKQADRDKGYPEITDRLAVVAGEDAKATGINRKTLMQAELGTELGNQVIIDIEVTIDFIMGYLLQVAVIG